MYEQKILKQFDKQIVIDSQSIQNDNKFNYSQKAVLNTEIKRLCDKNIIRRVGRGLYVRGKDTEWGKIFPTEQEITRSFYCGINGYISDVSYLNKIGITTWVPSVTYITTNKYRYKLYELKYTSIKKPKTTITEDNMQYLQLLDGIEVMFDNHIDAIDPATIFIKEIICNSLDGLKLVLYAKKYYTKKVLSYVLDLEEKLYDDTTFRQTKF